jgi:predicted tellurium resistance membrane protein TerC
MISPRRVAVVAVGLLAVGGFLGGPAWGDNPPAPGVTPAGMAVEIESADGTKYGARLALDALRVKTEYGAVELDVRKVKQLDLAPRNDGQVVASVTLTDKNHLVGTLLHESRPVATDGPPRAVPARDVRMVTFEHRRETTLLGAIIGLVTLTLMEIVLGVDNIIFLAIIAGKLPQPQQPKARRIGLIAALATRLLLLFTLTWILGLTRPIFTLPELPFLQSMEARGVSWRDVILLVGGAFLIGKSTIEMHEKLQRPRAEGPGKAVAAAAGFASIIVQIAVIDIIFSLDSVITAVGMVEEIWVMVVAMLIAVGIMMIAAEPIARFVDRWPTIKVLALSFLILIGVLLVAESLGQHINKGYIYFAMAFAVGVEMINMRLRGTAAPLPGEMPGEARDG